MLYIGLKSDLALRVYTSRLIGQDPDLVMHGGGNTSVKTRRPDLFGEMGDVLHIKGSGWDLDTLEAPGLPGVWLAPLHRLRDLDSLSDEDMVNAQRRNLLDSGAPNPSVETLLHAYLPHKFVDHTHSTPFLVLANQPDAETLCRVIFGDRLAIVDYIMPGFQLFLAVMDAIAEVAPHPLPEVAPAQLVDQLAALVAAANALEHGVTHFRKAEHTVADVRG